MLTFFAPGPSTKPHKFSTSPLLQRNGYVIFRKCFPSLQQIISFSARAENSSLLVKASQTGSCAYVGKHTSENQRSYVHGLLKRKNFTHDV